MTSVFYTFRGCRFRPTVWLAMRASVLFAAYVVFTLISGAAQDMLYTSYKFYETDAMSLVQSFVLFALGAISHVFRESGVSKRCQPIKPSATSTTNESNPCCRVPAYVQAALGLSIAGNVLLTNYATEFLSFPIQVVFKSAKLLVAMVVRSLIFNKPNKRIDYYCAIMLSVGLIGFMWPSSSSDSSGGEPDGALDQSSRFVVGILCVLGSLLAEAVMLNVQEFYLFQKYEVSTEWVMMYGYLYSTASQALLLMLVGTFGRTMNVLLTLQPDIGGLMFAFPFFMWIGVTFLLFLVKDHGAVVASAANVVRKIIAVAFSFVYFGREITAPIAIGGVMVFGSIVWRSCVSEHGGHDKAKSHAAAPTIKMVGQNSGEGTGEGITSDCENGSPTKYEGTPWPGTLSNVNDENPSARSSVTIQNTESHLFSIDEEGDVGEKAPLTGIRQSSSGRLPYRSFSHRS